MHGKGRAAPRPRRRGIILCLSEATSGHPIPRRIRIGFYSHPILFYPQSFLIWIMQDIPSTSSADSRHASATPTKKLRLDSKAIDAKNMTVFRMEPQSPRHRINFPLSKLTRLRALRHTAKRTHPPLPPRRKPAMAPEMQSGKERIQISAGRIAVHLRDVAATNPGR